MNEYDAFCGLKQASEKSKLLVYPDNIRPKAKRDWTRVIQVIIKKAPALAVTFLVVIILGGVLWNY